MKIVNISGYTFIEVLVSVAVIFIVISITFAGYARLNQRQNLISSGQTMKNILRDAQARVYNSEINCDPGGNFIGWYADFTSKSIYGKCDSNSFSEKTFSLPDSISIAVTPGVSPILFRSLPRGVDNNYTVCLWDGNLSDNFYQIRINQSGEIVDSDGLIPSCL